MTPEQIKALAKMNKPCKFKSGLCIYCNDTKKTAKANKCGGWNVPDPTVFDISRTQLSQQIGEMTAQEWRTVQAALAVVSSNYKKTLEQLISEAKECRVGVYVCEVSSHWYGDSGFDVRGFKVLPPVGTKLYLAPPAAQPVKPLTDAEIMNCDPHPHSMFDMERIDFARAIEAAHGIKEQS